MAKKKSASRSNSKKAFGKIEFKIENMVASAALGIDIDLLKIAQRVSNIEYEPEQFPGAILKFKDPKASLLLFKNGKIICTGCRSEKEVAEAIKKTTLLVIKNR